MRLESGRRWDERRKEDTVCCEKGDEDLILESDLAEESPKVAVELHRQGVELLWKIECDLGNPWLWVGEKDLLLWRSHVEEGALFDDGAVRKRPCKE